MDPNPYSEQPGFKPDPGESGNSVNYLRRLKAQIEIERGSEAAAVAPRAPRAPALPPTSPSGKERRRSPRYRCTGSVAFTPEGSSVRLWGTLTDISLRGCYVEMTATSPVDTKVDLVLDALGIRIRAQGVVRISYPALGMGILLTVIAPEQKVFLDQLLAKLAHADPLTQPPMARERSAANLIAAAEPHALLSELSRFFDNNLTLTRETFRQIAERCQRP